MHYAACKIIQCLLWRQLIIFFIIVATTCLPRHGDKVAIALDCDYIKLPYALPIPQISWYKDGELVYSTEVSSVPDASAFFAANPLLEMGVLSPPPIHTLADGSILLSNQVENITSPSLLPPGTTVEQVKEQLHSFLLGNWTCKLNNTLGDASHTHMIRDCSKLLQIKNIICSILNKLDLPFFFNLAPQSIPVPEVYGLCSFVIWDSGLSDSALFCEDVIGYYVLLYHPESKHQNLTRHVETYKTYYKITDEDKEANINHETRVQVLLAGIHALTSGYAIITYYSGSSCS
jgi:hypothetical protein